MVAKTKLYCFILPDDEIFDSLRFYQRPNTLFNHHIYVDIAQYHLCYLCELSWMMSTTLCCILEGSLAN